MACSIRCDFLSLSLHAVEYKAHLLPGCDEDVLKLARISLFAAGLSQLDFAISQYRPPRAPSLQDLVMTPSEDVVGCMREPLRSDPEHIIVLLRLVYVVEVHLDGEVSNGCFRISGKELVLVQP